MSEDILRNVKNFLASGKGDAKRLREILNTIKEGQPLVMSDFKYIESISTSTGDSQEVKEDQQRQLKQEVKKDESIEILRIRLAEGQITVDQFRELKKALTTE